MQNVQRNAQSANECKPLDLLLINTLRPRLHTAVGRGSAVAEPRPGVCVNAQNLKMRGQVRAAFGPA